MSTDAILNGFEKLLGYAGEHGKDEAIKLLVSSTEGAALSLRRKTALFAAAFRGHHISSEALAEQPYGYVGQCSRCGQVLKVPREPVKGEPILGRAVQFECPAVGEAARYSEAKQHGSKET